MEKQPGLAEQKRNGARTPDSLAQTPIDLPCPVATEAQVRAEFVESGTTVAEWARARGFSASLTRMVLAGKRKCLRGQSHEIAVALRLKAGRQ